MNNAGLDPEIFSGGGGGRGGWFTWWMLAVEAI